MPSDKQLIEPCLPRCTAPALVRLHGVRLGLEPAVARHGGAAGQGQKLVKVVCLFLWTARPVLHAFMEHGRTFVVRARRLPAIQ